MGSKRTYTVKEIKRLNRAEADLLTPLGIGGGAVLLTEHHDLEGQEHTAKSGALLVRNVISPAQLVVNTNDWSPTGLATADVIRVSTDASRNLTGIVAPTSGYQAIVLENIGAFDLVLKHNVTSSAVNRFYCPNDADMTLQKDSTAILLYDITTTRWRVIGGGGGGAGATFGTPAIVLGTAAAAGSIDEVIRRDSTIVAFDATAPSTQAFGDAAAAGSAAVAPRRDHKHAMPANPVTAHEAASDPHTGYLLESLGDAKGDLPGFSADNTPARIAAGTEGQIPVARAAATPGIAWEDRYGAIEIVIDGGGAVITTGVKGDFEIPYALTLTAWRLFADVAGAIQIDVWRDTYTNFPPTDGDSITNSNEAIIPATNQKAEDTTITNWNEACVAGEILRINVDSVTSIKRVTLSLLFTKA